MKIQIVRSEILALLVFGALVLCEGKNRMC